MVTLAGCGLFEESADERLARELDQHATFTVFMDDEATERQKSDVRAWLEKRPGITEITFEDRAAAAAKARKLFADEPEFLEYLNEDTLPESFRLRLENSAATREIRDTAAGKELEALPGVRQVVYPCTSVEECRKDNPFWPSPSPAQSAGGR
ncbi:hypothetical protein MB27_23145 [Actinoplanes utahensis]|uniref:FtsX extracellular domain-containing protein n=1 Tax=Actinoplanes utahensis TaxID=1869 RepID=A0A0A6UJW8_ACTUT|nr:hypothetical protein MB27_23145 [Actinoplanes utahensis]